MLYELRPITDDACAITTDAKEAARGSWLCTGCPNVNPGVGAVDVRLKHTPKDIAVNFIYGLHVGVVRRDFLAVLGEDVVAQELLLGRVLDAQGHQIPDFVTCRGRSHITIRGNAKSPYRHCEVCGQHIYSPMGRGYVLSGMLGNARIYESQLSDLVVGEAIAQNVQQRKWNELAVVRLPIVDVPDDGRPIF